jgi:beta-glucosidase
VGFDWGDGGPAAEVGHDRFSVRWTGRLVPDQGGEYELSVSSDDGVRLWLDGKLLIDDWQTHATETKKATVILVAGREYDLKLEYFEQSGRASITLGWAQPKTLFDRALRAAGRADAVVVCAGLSRDFESESFDRPDMTLPGAQDELIRRVCAANRNVVVVLQAGAPVRMTGWIDRAPAVVIAWYGGQEAGHAAADIVLGLTNPSGKLPVTFPLQLADTPAYLFYPGRDNRVEYGEGIFVGYRHYDKENKPVLFPFGHGLSYTTFNYSNLQVTPLSGSETASIAEISVVVENTGRRQGTEIVQLYVRDRQASLKRPDRELKRFSRVTLRPGEKKTVRFSLATEDLQFYDHGRGQWTAEPGIFEILAGSSSRDIHCQGELTYAGEK